MGITTGLRAIKEMDEAAARRKTKVNWLVVPKNSKVEIIFLQELDESSERYSEKNGLGFLAQEHNNPSRDQFFKRVLCINDEEHDFKCWACEKNGKEWDKSTEENKYNGGWGRKTNFYINVLVRYEKDGEKIEEVAVLQRTRSKRSYVDQIIDLAIEDGFISNRLFTLSRKGEGFDTVYTLTHRKEDAGINVEDYELFDLNDLVTEADYEEQAARLGYEEVEERPVPSLAKSRPAAEESNPEDDSDDWL